MTTKHNAASGLSLVFLLVLAFGFSARSAQAATFVQDTFTGTASTTLQSHTGQIGATWKVAPYRSGSVEVLTGTGRARVGTNSSTESVYLPSGAPINANYSVQASIFPAKVNTCAFLGARFSTSTYTGYMAGGCGGGTAFYKYVNGTQTALAGASYSFTAGATTTLKFTTVTVGNTAVLTLYANNAQVGTVTDASSPILSSGEPALWLNSLGQGFSNTASYLVGNFSATDITLPTVTAQSATSTTQSGTTLNGTITADGNASSTVIGFNYGLTTSYGATSSASGTFGVGSFNQTISGLTASTTYHFRAFATNAVGTAYSSDQTFTTLAGTSSPAALPFVQDSFTDAGNAIGLHTGEVGSPWRVNENLWPVGLYPTNYATTTGVITAQGRARAGTFLDLSTVFVAQGTPVSPDYDVQADYYNASSGGCGGIGSRWSTFVGTGYFMAACNGSSLQLYKYLNGTLTALGSPVSYTFAVNSTTTLKLSTRTIGGNAVLTMYANGVQEGSYTDSSSPILSAGGAALFFNNNGTQPADNAGPQFDNFLATDATTSNAIAISSPVSYQVFQRSATNTATIYISGVFTGSPTSIQASWNGGAFQTITATTSGRTWSGVLTNQPAGQGTLTVRFGNSPSTTASVPYVGVGDVFVIAGQSNAAGHGSSNQTYSSPTFKAGLFGFDYEWKQLADPAASDYGQVDPITDNAGGALGSVWPLVATDIMAAENVPVAFIEAPLGGAPIINPYGGLPLWSTIDASNHEDRTTLYGQMLYRAIESSPDGVKAVLWWEGESDAYVNGTQSSVQTALLPLTNTLYSDLGVRSLFPVLQDCTAVATTSMIAINDAIQADWSATPAMVAGPYFYDTPSDDGFHFITNANLALAASRWWNAIDLGLYATSSPYSVTNIATSTFEVALMPGTFFGPAAVGGVPDYTISISDGGAGGTIVPSVGVSGTSSVTVAPAASSSSFTFTYSPATVGTTTLTFTNAQGWGNPAPITFYVSATSSATSTTFVQDSFTDVAGTPLSSHTGQIGATWTPASYLPASAAVITASGTVRANSTSTTESVFLPSGTPSSPNYSVQADEYDASNVGCGYLGIRFATSTYSGYMAGTCFGGAGAIYKYLNGVQTQLAVFPQTYTPGQTYTTKFSASTVGGNALLTVWINGNQVATYTDTSSPILSSGEPTLWLNSLGNPVSDASGYQFDNLIATTP